MMIKLMTALSAPARWLTALALVVAGAFLLSACGGHAGTKEPEAAPPAATRAVATPAVSELDLTEAVMDSVWGNYTDSQKNDVCDEVQGQTPAWVAAKLREGGENSDLIDWDEAAMFVMTACVSEGR
jgi:hypothetical protein